MAYEVTCKICGKTFIGRNKNYCTCSEACRKKSQAQYNKTYRQLTNKTSKIRTCPVCGKTFEQEMAHQILCSRECADVREKEQAQGDRLENLILHNDNGTDDERLQDTLIDMANYCIMTAMYLVNKESDIS